MSVSVKHYIIFGVLLNKEKVKKFKDHSDENEDFFNSLQFYQTDSAYREGSMGILEDAMSDEYIIAGKCVKIADEYEGFPLTDVNGLTTTIEDYRDVRRWLLDNFLPKLIEGISSDGIISPDGGFPIKIWLVSHYT